MRVGVAATRITSPSQVETGVITTDAIENGTIINEDVAAAAAIAYAKLNLTGGIVDADIDNAADIMSGKIDLGDIGQDIIPDDDNLRSLGSSAFKFATIYAHDAEGGLKALLLMGM